MMLTQNIHESSNGWGAGDVLRHPPRRVAAILATVSLQGFRSISDVGQAGTIVARISILSFGLIVGR